MNYLGIDNIVKNKEVRKQIKERHFYNESDNSVISSQSIERTFLYIKLLQTKWCTVILWKNR